MRKAAILAGVAALPFLLSSCFVLNDFWVGAPTLNPGQKTTAFFALYPASTTSDISYQFVLVGVDDPAQLGIGRATWGSNGTFGGPVPMTLRGNLDDLFANPGTCTSSGLDFADITGMTWKGFSTPTPVNDRGRVGRLAMVEVRLSAKTTASTDERSTVVGVTGSWGDDGDGIPESPDDTFTCTGISISSTYVV